MKKLFTLSTFSLLLVFSTFTFAQTPPPEGINYQAVARDTSGNPLSSSLNLVVKFTILSDTSSGTIIFTEIHSPVNTNRYGLFTLVIGSIETTDFQNLDWAAGDKFLQVEIATVGGSSYTSMGKTLMMSVPYALHSKTSGSATNNWGLQGNSLSNPTDFIGTNNSQDLVVKTAGTERMRIQSGGNVGIGTSNPASLFSVGAASEFQVDSTGAIDTATGIISSGVIRFSGLSPDGIVRSTGSNGTLMSGLVNLTSEVTDSLPVANGGTGLTSLGNWQAFYSDGIGAFTPFALGDSGKVFQSNGPASAPSWTAPSSLMQNLTNGTGISPFIYNGSTAAAINIAPSGIAAGTYNSLVSGQTITIPSFTVNAQGQITAVSNTTLSLNAEAPLTFNNGLTRNVNTIQLGGPLTQNTTITGGGFNTLFDLNSTGDFKINKNGNIPAFFVNPTTGFVGIGTSTPPSPLTIQSIAGTDIEFVATGSTFSDISANSQLNIGSTTSSIHLKTSAATRFFVGSAGDIGIGTTSPGAKLEVAGTIKIVDGTEGAGKMLTSDAAGLASWTTPVAGSGTLNYIPKWIPNGTTLGNSRIFDNGTYVGIGTNNPLAGLVISGSSLWSSAIGIENTTASMEWRIATTTTGMLSFVKIPGATFTAMTINPTTGNVGIGTAAPSAKLHSSAGTGTGSAGLFDNFNASNSSSTLVANTNGSGNAIFASNTGTWRAGTFTINNAANIYDALYAETNGTGSAIFGKNTSTGKAGTFQILNSASTADALYVTSNGSGSRAFNVLHTGTTGAGTNYGAYVKTNGTRTGATTNVGGYFTASGAANSYAAIFDQGNVGIGTTTPSSKFHTSGGVRFDTLAGTGVRFILTDATGKIFAGAATGSPGTLNYVAKFTTGGTTLGNSLIFDNGTNVGIGTSSPTYALDLQAAVGAQQIKSTTVTNTAYTVYTNIGGNVYFGINNSVGTSLSNTAQPYAGVFNVTGAYPLVFSTNGGDRMIINSSGNVGIGTATPQNLLTIGPNPTVAYNANELLQLAKTGDAYMTIRDGTATWLMGSTSGLPFVGTQSNHPITFRTNNIEQVRVTAAGNVGIGTATPTSTLQVNGSLSLPIVSKSLNYAVTDSDFTVICTAVLTITLPPPAPTNKGRIYIICALGGNVIVTNSVSSPLVSVGKRYMYQSDGTDWFLISE